MSEAGEARAQRAREATANGRRNGQYSAGQRSGPSASEDFSPFSHFSHGASENWPSPIDEPGFSGRLGKFVREVSRDTEADPSATLVQLMCGVSAMLSPLTYMKAGDAFHPPRVSAVIVGKTAGGRKGSGGKIVESTLIAADPAFAGHIVDGLSSGEGLIWAIRDPIQGFDRKTQKDILVDPGVEDKRLLVLEGEFVSALKVMQREGNTLSAVVRRAWDLGYAGVLRSLTKNSPARATGAHISIIGHITPRELSQHMDRTDLMNGFGNRFVWGASKMAQELPFGEEIDSRKVLAFAQVVKDAATWTAQGHRMRLAQETRAPWQAAYHALIDRPDNLYGAATARGAPIVLRLAEVYAAFDKTDAISVEHLAAALAVWDYSDRTCRWLFGESLGDPTADTILLALRRSGSLTRDQIYELLKSRHVSKPEVERALALLESEGLARMRKETTGGRPTEIWEAVA